MLTDLHPPLLPILRHALALAPLPRTGVALDLACGPGLKAPLLAAACGPGVRLIGIDVDRAAIRTARADCRTGDTRHATFLVGDALALPLGDGCCAAAFCIAALSLFADRRAALRDLWRALAPGGMALFVVGAQAWAQTIHWPPDLAARLTAAYGQALADRIPPVPASPDLAGALADQLIEAGFAAPLIRAFMLDPSQTAAELSQPHDVTGHVRFATDHGPQTTAAPLAAELPLLLWPALRPVLRGRLAPAELERCDRIAADPELELCGLALVAQAQVV